MHKSTKNEARSSITPTSRGSRYALYLLDNAIKTAGIMNLNDPPITTGSRVPNQDCNRVFTPATKSKVCIT